MGLGYQFSDRWSFDYELWYSDELKMALRGPQTIFDSHAGFLSFAGAAQTFGRFAEKPFPALVSAWARKPHINLGFAGAGPGFFVQSQPLIDKINESELCFLQIMSGRSISTSLLRTVGFGGVLEFTSGPLRNKRFLAALAYRKLREVYGDSALNDQVHEARSKWVTAYRSLLTLIKVPIVCVWTSSRASDEYLSSDPARDLLGSFPHLIGPTELKVFDEFGLQIVGSKLLQKPEQLLHDYTTRRPAEVYAAKMFATRPDWSRTFNTYYPTQEMHEAISTDIIVHLAQNARFGLQERTEMPRERNRHSFGLRRHADRVRASIRRNLRRVPMLAALGKMLFRRTGKSS